MTTPPLAAVIGDPVGHSLSPRLFRHWLEKMSLNGGYVPLRIAPETLSAGLDAMRLLGFRGGNVTLPHKTAILDLATEVTPRARAIGAANTITFLSDGGLHADNTDGVGFLTNLRQASPQWSTNAPALVLGAGGAARAVLWGLIEAGCPRIYLANRTHARAEALAKQFGPTIVPLPWDAIPSHLSDVGTLVNTTSLGMVGQPELQLSLDGIQSQTLVTDIVYTPLMTSLLHDARARGCPVVDGLGMLLHQAVPGFERWFGVRPEVTADTREHILRALV